VSSRLQWGHAVAARPWRHAQNRRSRNHTQRHSNPDCPLEASIIIHPVGCSRPFHYCPTNLLSSIYPSKWFPLFVIHPSQQILERWTDRIRFLFYFSIFKSSAKYIHIYYMYFSKINLTLLLF
jgi:hypothetical protein